ncbi:HTH-type dhaKLM operon transcriptional activator DhaS [Lachnospiraceae bacterium]|jgi:probable dihydroxyacetone kinase regulator|nr:TetR family transcriptional regulator [Lachnospiraceae bacterium]GFI68537.1 HTH-type dhaKLM operon transcriptional activator DhaS [Lachnospiraceae bacterium]
MTQTDISLKTKQTMVASLKKFMETKPLSRITVSEICKDCGFNRKTFYYHFEDIYDLLRWMLEQEAIIAVKKFNLLEDSEKVVRFLLDYVDSNKHILNCVYDAMGREGMKRFFLADFNGSIDLIIAGMEKETGTALAPGYRQFLCSFYSNALSGILIDWFHDRTIRTREEMIRYITMTVASSLRGAVSAKADSYSPAYK